MKPGLYLVTRAICAHSDKAFTADDPFTDVPVKGEEHVDLEVSDWVKVTSVTVNTTTGIVKVHLDLVEGQRRTIHKENSATSPEVHYRYLAPLT